MAYKERLLVSGRAGGATNCMSVSSVVEADSWVAGLVSEGCWIASLGQNQKARAAAAAKTNKRTWFLLKGKEDLRFESAIAQI